MVIQWIVIILAVGASAAYLGRMAYRMVRGKSTGCGCDKCPAGSAGRDSSSSVIHGR